MTEKTSKKKATGRLIVIGIFLLVMIVSVWVLPLEAWLQEAQRWSEDNPWQGRLYYLVAFVIGACLMVPGSLLFLSGGYLFGFLWGGALAVLATPLAAVAAYVLGATVARGPVASLVADNQRFDAIDKAIDQKGFLIVLLTRLSMVLPYNVLNYAFSVTRVRLTDYFIATAIGMVPPVLLFAYVGAAANDVRALTGGGAVDGPWGKVIGVVGLGLLIAAFVIIQRTATRILNETLSEVNAESDGTAISDVSEHS
ncbi:MAG: TVP38/TMEM64 family protein [Pseudomonadota bacterium]